MGPHTQNPPIQVSILLPGGLHLCGFVLRFCHCVSRYSMHYFIRHPSDDQGSSFLFITSENPKWGRSHGFRTAWDQLSYRAACGSINANWKSHRISDFKELWIPDHFGCHTSTEWSWWNRLHLLTYFGNYLLTQVLAYSLDHRWNDKVKTCIGTLPVVYCVETRTQMVIDNCLKYFKNNRFYRN